MKYQVIKGLIHKPSFMS